jgi:glutamate/tyrosine decarboxylase-like PLP-dependent enzyme
VSERELLRRTADIAADYLDGLAERPVHERATADELRAELDGRLPEEGETPAEVVELLARAGEAGAIGMAGGRYFGFVIGGSLPAALAADWLTSTWDQNAGLYVGGPAASVAEDVALRWLRDLLGLPEHASGAIVTGCQMAHVTCLAAARNHVLAQAGWDVERRGLAGSPPIRVIAGTERHVTVDRALRYLGLGTDSVVPVRADGQGRIDGAGVRAALAAGDGPTIVCAQVGNVNTGAVDPMPDIVAAAREAGAWVHVDGAFGLWAAASPVLRHIVAGAEEADSWATDAHKWLNVPYDSGLVFCAHPQAHRAAMTTHASYLIQADDGGERDQMHWTPEFSRRARGFTVYAALRSLGRSGVADLVDRSCRHARRFGELLTAEHDVAVLNEIVLNQVLVRFADDDETTRRVVTGVQEDGTCWLSGTTWQGRAAMRISVCNWQTTDEDVERSAAAILGVFAAARSASLAG